jgi:Domain of Unknown Function with PDB structure (DUF3857)/Transglutaminase-like superfamily
MRSTLLWLCLGLGAALWQPAQAQYVPNLTVLRTLDRFHVQADGMYTQTMEVTVRVDTPQGVASDGERKITFNEKLETLEIQEAYTLLPDGTRVDVPADKIRKQDNGSDDGYSDEKMMVVIYPKVQVGSQLYLRAKSEQITPKFPGHFYWHRYFSPHHVYAQTEVNFLLEPGANVAFDAEGVEGGLQAPLPEDAPGVRRYRFTFSQKQFFPPESGRVALSDFGPHLAASTFVDYAQFAKAYQDRAKPMAAVTPAIAKLAAELTANAKDDRARVRSLYNWVSDNIRYVAVFVGDDGFVPHSAQSVLDNRYGDCKDHVVLLEALLAAVGIDSSTALINLGTAYRLPKLPIATPFNHVITYVPSLNLYLDSTTQLAPMGTLPDDDMAKPVLLTAYGTLGKTPGNSPERDFTHTEIRMVLQNDGALVGTSKARMGGHLEVSSRMAQFNNQNKDQRHLVSELLARFQESGSGEVAKSAPEDLDRPWEVSTTFALDPQVNVPGPSAMTIPYGLVPGHLKAMSNYTPPKARRYPLACSSVRHTESTTLTFPPNLKIERIPQGTHSKSGAFEYESRYTLKGQELKVQRVFTSRRANPVCDAQDDKDWLDYRRVLQRDLRAQVFFR